MISGRVRRPGRDAVDAEPVRPRRPDPGEAFLRLRSRMTDRAGEPLEMDERDARMLGIRSAETAGEDRSFPVRVFAEMTAAAGEGCRRPVAGVGRLALVAADHEVAEVAPVAVRALEPGRRVDIGVGRPHGRVFRRDRVADEAAVVGGLVVQIEEVALLGIEIDRSVLDGRHDGPFMVVEVGPVIDVPRLLEPGGHAADLADASGRRGRPAQVLAQDLLGPLAVVLAARPVVTGQAVDLGLAGDVPSRRRLGQDLLVGRARPARRRACSGRRAG